MRLKKEFKKISKHYNHLISIINSNYFVGITNEWIVDNYYLIVERSKKLIAFENNKKLYKYTNKNVDMYAIINEILRKHNYIVDPKLMIEELFAYQKETNYNFRYKELFIVPNIMEIILIKRIAYICQEEKEKLKQKQIVDKIITKLKIGFLNYSHVELKNYLNIRNISDSGIVYFNNQLKDLGENANAVLKELNVLLALENKTLREIINEEYIKDAQTNIVVRNLFQCLSFASMIEIEKLYEKLNDIERTLIKDKDYSKMTLETKEIFRNYLVKKAKKGNVEFLDFLKETLSEEKKLTSYIIAKETSRVKGIFYVSVVILLTILFSYFLSSLLSSYRWHAFLILLIPTSELVVTFVKRLFLEFHKSEPVPKLNFSKGIPDNCKTMVVIPTIIKNEARIREVLTNLEKYYLANKSKNLYFALLGDCHQSDQQDHPDDELIVETGKQVIAELNKKYGENTFNFVYRRRKYNEGEGCWLGFERKRGALLHFNDLLLGNLTETEKKDYFKGQSFDDFNQQIRYVITLDVDTGLGLGAIWKLIGAMAHPLNKPILNEEKTKVIKGHAMMQPRISMDIESSNATLFSKLYAGIGGFDPYNYIYPNFYQDVFGEGNFCGKGIYDLEVAQLILKDRFPNNLILSHDLLEGGYLRCADLVDVEFIDDFPPKFFIDANRRSRWARGDMQIINWIFPKVKNRLGEDEKNPLSVIGRWKIFDNIRRGLIDLFNVLILIVALMSSIINPLWWLLFITIIYLTPIMSEVFNTIFIFRRSFPTLKHYKVLIIGYKAIILRAVTSFTCMLFNAYLYVNSFIRSLYRMLVSKKKLLNWVTAEDAAKLVDTSFKNTIKQFWLNYLLALFFIIFSMYFSSFDSATILIIMLLVLGPIIIYFLGEPSDKKRHVADTLEKEFIVDVAKRTWDYFADGLKKETNYLIYDNYQLNKDIKEDARTSPTNIGLSLVSIVSAYEMEFISFDKALYLIENIINVVVKLDKWHGHLFNWYDRKTLEVMQPRFVSSIDSGNFVASLMVVRGFLKKHDVDNKLIKTVRRLIRKTDFKWLYTKDDVFTIGYDVDKGLLSTFNYNKFMSESRILSYVAIAKGDVPLKHWFCLDKTLITYKRHKGLSTWGGTAFEYYMPLIFMKSYTNTILDESYYFASFAKIDYMKKVNPNYPWGMSESAYNELDEGENYKYKAFGVPQLKLKDEPIPRVVVSPYGSILAITLYPKAVLENLQKFLSLNMLGDYGFFESYDFFDNTQVKAYYTHHQAMILSSFCNYLNDGAIQNYFSDDVNNQAFMFLNKERIQVRPSINYKIMKLKKYTYDKEPFVNDIRVYNQVSSLPQLTVLSNSKYSVIINDLGSGYSKYRTIKLNRYRKVTEQDYGQFLYIKDLTNRRVWSNTYAPCNKQPDNYEVVFALDKVKFTRSDKDIITTTEITVTRGFDAEIRKITLKNNGNKNKRLEITSYMEPILSKTMDDIGHPAFSNLFIDSEYDSTYKAIIMSRKERVSNNRYYMINRLLIMNPLKEYEYETNRFSFIGRGFGLKKPKALDERLSNRVGVVLDPIISLRNTVLVPKNDEVVVYLITGFGRSKKQVLNIVKSLNSEQAIVEQGFETATIMSNITSKMTNVTVNDMRLYNIMLNYLLQTKYLELDEGRQNIVQNNVLSSVNLYKFGISGKFPTILLEVSELENLSLVKELLMAFEYYKSKSIFIDLIIVNNKKEDVLRIITKEVNNEIYRMNALNSFKKLPGNIYIFDKKDLLEEEIVLLKTLSRIIVDSAIFKSLEQYISNLQSSNLIISRKEQKEVKLQEITYDKPIELYNGYGGFINDGKEYIITNQNTPHAWSNVISNDNFGTIITNDNGGFTYYKNSQEYKLTSWVNDVLLKDASEGFRINDIRLSFNLVKHGFGYSEFNGNFRKVDVTLLQYVANEASVKYYKLKFKNNGYRQQRIILTYWINPVLGFAEEKTSRYIVTNYNKNGNYLWMQNTYNKHYSDVCTFMASNLEISNVLINNLLFKEIEVDFYLDSKEEKEVIFTLGATDNYDELDSFVKQYTTEKRANEELKLGNEKWSKRLGKIQVKTPDVSFDYMVNGWLLYQTLSSRIQARAGYYQVGGAFGYRDQLQDAMNICIVDSKRTREQIIINAQHQFKEGDVLHWWHSTTKTGLRSLYKDDYLWLIYATSEYIKITEDLSILDVQIPFVVADGLNSWEQEKVVEYTYSEEEKSLFEHCRLALHKAMKELGTNGLPLIGGGDWNDGMNKVGIKGQGTSVWLGFFLYMMIEKFVALANKYDPKINLSKYFAFNIKLKESLRNNGWDKDYYLRAFFDNGNPIGSSNNEEGQIDLLSQSFAILSDIASPQQVNSIIEAVEEQLVDQEAKIIKLLDPPFKNSKDYPGYIMDYPKGVRENGGQYTHATAWYIMALLKLGHHDLAYKHYQMINPINRTLKEKDVETYTVEPYVMAADIYSNEQFLGKGGWTWYTGSSAWFYKVAISNFLGFKIRGEKVYFEPKVPTHWNDYIIEYKYKNTTYKIEVLLKQKETKITMDDKELTTDYIMLKNDKKVHKVIVLVGDKND